MRLNLIIICLLLSATAQASPVIIDFDTYELGDVPGGGVTSKGFQFEYANVWGAGSFLEGSLFWQPQSTTTLTQVDGGSFDLLSLDLNVAEVFDPSFNSYHLTGYLEGGGTVEASFSPPESLLFTTYSLGSEWSNLTSVEIFNPDGFGGVDNLVVTTVPIPAAAWLFGSALAGLGWLRQRQTPKA